jgi:hypothetical protein
MRGEGFDQRLPAGDCETRRADRRRHRYNRYNSAASVEPAGVLLLALQGGRQYPSRERRSNEGVDHRFPPAIL